MCTPGLALCVLNGLPLASSPDAFDNELIVSTLCDIKEGKLVQIPVYDFVNHSRCVCESM